MAFFLKLNFNYLSKINALLPPFFFLDIKSTY